MKRKPYSEDEDLKVDFTGNVVNAYIEILRKVNSKALVFYTDFIQSLHENSFANLDPSYKVSSITEASSVIVPIDYREINGFMGLLIWSQKILSFYDPRNLDLNSKYTQENIKLAQWFQEEFIEKLYSHLICLRQK